MVFADGKNSFGYANRCQETSLKNRQIRQRLPPTGERLQQRWKENRSEDVGYVGGEGCRQIYGKERKRAEQQKFCVASVAFENLLYTTYCHLCDKVCHNKNILAHSVFLNNNCGPNPKRKETLWGDCFTETGTQDYSILR